MTALTGMFIGAHALLAQLARTPELEMSQEEATSFMGAAERVARHYSITTTQKTLDWIAFMGIAAGIYGTRFVAIAARKRHERPVEAAATFTMATVGVSDMDLANAA